MKNLSGFGAIIILWLTLPVAEEIPLVFLLGYEDDSVRSGFEGVVGAL